MPRPPVKKTERLAYAQKLGELKAELKIRSKYLGQDLYKHALAMLENADIKDAVPLLACMGFGTIYGLKRLNDAVAGSAFGAIAWGLATAESEAAAIAGLSMLTVIGVGVATPTFAEIKAQIDDLLAGRDPDVVMKGPEAKKLADLYRMILFAGGSKQ